MDAEVVDKVLEEIAILRNRLEDTASRYPELAQIKLAEAAGLHRAFEIVRENLYIPLLEKENA